MKEGEKERERVCAQKREERQGEKERKKERFFSTPSLFAFVDLH